ncbi:MAG: hypothetical protein FGM15_03420 [Chthoniobacterales bacterium]|nr:hypothetical protein [Chthoniobacterales bacterium]
MNKAESKLMQEIKRLHLARYDLPTDSEAVSLAHSDLLSAPDYLHSAGDKPCKMHATDVLHLAAIHSPKLINEIIIRDCIGAFGACNDASKINTIRIMSALRRRDAVKFLEEVRDDKTRPNAVTVKKENGKHVFAAYRDDSQPDLVADEARKALERINNIAV